MERLNLLNYLLKVDLPCITSQLDGYIRLSSKAAAHRPATRKKRQVFDFSTTAVTSDH